MNTTSPIVSIICVCYNHSAFVIECLQSVVDQTYPDFEVIVVDDASSDESRKVISDFVVQYPEIKFIALESNLGICKAFNAGYRESRGKFIIDLAADDILERERLSAGVSMFDELSDAYGVVFSDAEWVDESRRHLYFHSDKFPHASIPQGDVYLNLIERYFICSPTMMFRRSVVDALNGYDESLTYEDFDFWIRSSRKFKYAYDPNVRVKKRKLKNSLSADQYKIRSRHNFSTYRVCEKILELSINADEYQALRRRVRYEIRQCIRTLDFSLIKKYFALQRKVQSAAKR